jgi:uncharacterized membrane-anchored protein YitT (DUF2179 family)
MKAFPRKLPIRPQSLIMMFFAGCISAIAVTMFLAPVHLYDSGIAGTSMLLWQITPDTFTLSFFLVVLNIPLFLIGLHKQGLEFTINAVWAVIVFSAASHILPNNLPFDVSSASPFAGDDLLLCALFGGLIAGIGSGISIRFGGAIDGIFAKRVGITVGTFVMIYNILQYIVIGIVFSSWVHPLYSIVAYCVAIRAVDFIVEGLDKAKSAMIVTSKEQEISEALSAAFGKGITHINARGYYSDVDRTIIYFVVNRFQVTRLKSIVTQIDRDAFITITEVSDVLGKSVKTSS